MAERQLMSPGRFLLFYGSRYYPDGGWEDFKGSFESTTDARAAVPLDPKTGGDGFWWHIVDTEIPAIVASGKEG